jgi:hypothetical protein
MAISSLALKEGREMSKQQPIQVGDRVLLYQEMKTISGCRVLELKDERALIRKPRGGDEWVQITRLLIEDE